MGDLNVSLQQKVEEAEDQLAERSVGLYEAVQGVLAKASAMEQVVAGTKEKQDQTLAHLKQEHGRLISGIAEEQQRFGVKVGRQSTSTQRLILAMILVQILGFITLIALYLAR